MKRIKGNLLDYFDDNTFDVIIHGCNCFNTMGAGIAKQIKYRYPEVYEADKRTIKGDKLKLGNYSFYAWRTPIGNKFVINGYTQYHWQGRYNVDYNAIQKLFTTLNDWFVLENKKIGIPKIGAGLAGGDWEKIEKIIIQTTPNLDITLVEYAL